MIFSSDIYCILMYSLSSVSKWFILSESKHTAPPEAVPVCGDNWAGGHVTQFWRENVDFNKALVCWSGATAGHSTQAAGSGPGTGCRIRVFHFAGNTHLLHQITWRLYIQNCKYLNIDSHHHQFMCCCKEDSDFLTTFPKYFQSIPWERSVKL